MRDSHTLSLPATLAADPLAEVLVQLPLTVVALEAHEKVHWQDWGGFAHFLYWQGHTGWNLG